MAAPPKYGTEVTTYVTIGVLDDCKVVGSYHPEAGVDIGEVSSPAGSRLRWKALQQADQDRIEQAIIDCYSAGEEPDSELALRLDRALYVSHARRDG